MTAILYFLYFLSFCNSGVGPATSTPLPNLQSDTIYWSPSNKLTWGDFQAKEIDKIVYKGIDSNSIHVYAYVNIEFTFNFKFEKKKSFVIANTVFIKSKSWTSGADSEALKHEQGHFDMAEIYLRTYKREMLEYQDLDGEKFIDLAFDKFIKMKSQLNEEAIRYNMATISSLGLQLYLDEIKKRLEDSEMK